MGNKREECGVPHLKRRQIPSFKQSNTPGFSLAMSLWKIKIQICKKFWSVECQLFELFGVEGDFKN